MRLEQGVTAVFVVVCIGVLAANMHMVTVTAQVFSEYTNMVATQYGRYTEKWWGHDPEYHQAVLQMIHFILEAMGVFTLVHTIVRLVGEMFKVIYFVFQTMYGLVHTPSKAIESVHTPSKSVHES